MPFRHDVGVPENPNRIPEWRERRNKMTQADLAQRSGVTQPTIQKLESGEMQLTEKYLRQLAAALSCAPADLLHGGSDVAVDPVEREVVRWYRQAQEKNQKALFDILRALAILPVEPTPPGAPAPTPPERPARPARPRRPGTPGHSTLHEDTPPIPPHGNRRWPRP